ncbi:MAG: UDP-N-acetylmuramyl-tripeptide synthetase [bacterium]|nr:UDP-N-acetylmuramyl-tripeptide synthetase [bacterium]
MRIRLKEIVRKMLPSPLLSVYHLTLAHFGAIVSGHPSRKLLVIAVTGTKGKSSTTEMLNAIFEEAGHKTALLNSIRIKIAESTDPNMMRMSMPGRFFIQRFLREAVGKKCFVAILEMTSEGAAQHRHRAIELDALVFTNLAPEHIESHGSYKAYADAKFELGRQLARSRKRPRVVVANADDPESARYLALKVERVLPFSLSAHAPMYADEKGGYFTLENTKIHVRLPGEFSLKNALAAATLARALNIAPAVIAHALQKLMHIPGRAERIEEGQNFTVVVDYAHTPDSLEAIYKAYGVARKICVLGSMGGSRDSWNRPVKGRIASEYCAEVILTNEDPCDDDPAAIIEQMRSGVVGKEPLIFIDRREAISKAFEIALSLSKSIHQPLQKARGNQNDIVVLITGKGTDPWIYGARGTKIQWSDARVAREELAKLAASRKARLGGETGIMTS